MLISPARHELTQMEKRRRRRDREALSHRNLLVYILRGIYGQPVQPYFIMEMRPRTGTGIPHVGYDIAAPDTLSGLHIKPGIVCEHRFDSVSMADFNHIAVSAAEPRLDHNAVRRSRDRSSGLCGDIDALV